ncbi:MAG: hypothetical protein PHV33_04970 [Elusimicrobiales bacterium]|nr:hypothetical protein [Elusimicrobiales bacterium]
MTRIGVLYLFFGAALPAAAADCASGNCGWTQARSYCAGRGGSLPTEKQLLQAWQDKCLGGKTSALCSGWYWADREESAGRAWGVSFRTGYVNAYRKTRKTQVYCGPGTRAEAKGEAPGSGSGEAAPAAGGGTGPCSAGRCTWYEAVSFCRSQGTRLMNSDEFELYCLGACPSLGVNYPDKAGEGCNRWFWMDKSQNDEHAFTGQCNPMPEFVTNIISAAKKSRSHARCAK